MFIGIVRCLLFSFGVRSFCFVYFPLFPLLAILVATEEGRGGFCLSGDERGGSPLMPGPETPPRREAREEEGRRNQRRPPMVAFTKGQSSPWLTGPESLESLSQRGGGAGSVLL